MTDGRINEQILRKLRESMGDDDAIGDFLVDLLYEEAEHSGQWWWTEIYKKKVARYAEKWESDNED